jgi:hypothetical protein
MLPKIFEKHLDKLHQLAHSDSRVSESPSLKTRERSTMKNNYSKNIGSVSCATMRPEDLIPAFVSELESQKPLKREHRKLLREIKRGLNQGPRGGVWGGTYFDTEDAGFDLEALFDVLDEYCLPYFYFGAHPDDGSDYGYWLSEGFEDDFDGLKVDDLSEVPTGYSGEVLHVSDHGNMTLYAYSRGRGREIWGIV